MNKITKQLSKKPQYISKVMKGSIHDNKKCFINDNNNVMKNANLKFSIQNYNILYPMPTIKKNVTEQF